jgi:predicted enzyme related to lactoylglutathione lyase
MSGNPVVCWELASHDQEKSAAFFRDVFGWDVPFDPDLGFYRANAPGGASASQGLIFTLRKAKLPFLTLYISVPDIDAKRDLVEQHGGFIVIEPTDIGGGERICLFNEPSGVTFAMIEERR